MISLYHGRICKPRKTLGPSLLGSRLLSRLHLVDNSFISAPDPMGLAQTSFKLLPLLEHKSNSNKNTNTNANSNNNYNRPKNHNNKPSHCISFALELKLAFYITKRAKIRGLCRVTVAIQHPLPVNSIYFRLFCVRLLLYPSPIYAWVNNHSNVFVCVCVCLLELCSIGNSNSNNYDIIRPTHKLQW